jgi:hypothetical protein
MIEGVIVKREPKNRLEKRKFKDELLKAQKLIIEIECEFEFMLFNDENKFSYKQLYDYFLGKWLKMVDVFFIKAMKFSYIIFDAFHFSRKYKPVV